MRPFWLILPIFLLLTACQSTQVHEDYDPTRNFAAYHTWTWKKPPVQFRPEDPRVQNGLTEQRILGAVSQQLVLQGLNPVQQGQTPDLEVQVWFIVDERTQQFTTPSMVAWGNPWYDYWDGPLYTETQTIQYQVGTLQLDFYDAKDGKLVWRGTGEHILRSNPGTPEERTEMFRETVAKILAQYPPQ